LEIRLAPASHEPLHEATDRNVQVGRCRRARRHSGTTKVWVTTRDSMESMNRARSHSRAAWAMLPWWISCLELTRLRDKIGAILWSCLGRCCDEFGI
jgi:hypothetical protein